jgi:hypothetical protein
MKTLISSILGLVILMLINSQVFAARLQIDGEFSGCEHGKLYEIMGGGILECREYNYFYEYSPEVRTDGRDVITIGDQKIDAYVHDGTIINTQVDGDFEGCDFDKRINFTNGLIFVCSTYSYTYSYMPRVKIFVIKGRSPQVFIQGKSYSGTLYRR